MKQPIRATVTNLLFFLIISIVIFLPFQAVVGEILAFKSVLSQSQIFWLQHWYEPFVLLLVLGLIPYYLSRYRLNALSIIAWTLLLLGIFRLLPIGLGRGIEGFRFTLFMVPLFLIAFSFRFSLQQKVLLKKSYLLTALIVALWAIVERFFPSNYWSLWGLISPVSQFGYGHFPVADIQRSASFMGPNQLASYLLPAFFILLFKVKEKLSWERIAVLLILFLGICFALSRASLAGLVVGLLIFCLFYLPRKAKIWFGGIGILCITTFVLFYLAQPVQFNRLFVRTEQSDHISGILQAQKELAARWQNKPIEFFFGEGLGTAGPVVLKYGDGQVPESWYFQIALELGLVGVLLWLVWIGFLAKGLLGSNERGLFLGLISVSITAIFLHTFADNPALSFTLFPLIGISLKEKNVKQSKSV